MLRRIPGTTLAIASAVLYAPVAHLAVLVYRVARPTAPRYVEVVPGLHVGGAIYPWNVVTLRRKYGITSVLNCCWELHDITWRLVFRRRRYRQLFLPDGVAPSMRTMRRAVEFVKEQIDRGETVLVHCAYGRCRSVTIVAAYLLASGFAERIDEVERFVLSRRPQGFLRRCQRRALERWVENLDDAIGQLTGGDSDDDVDDVLATAGRTTRTSTDVSHDTDKKPAIA